MDTAKRDLDRLLQRFHAVLVEEIRARRPQYLREPFTVAEIYQELTPYGSHRDRIGAAMNGDYEHALLRLLAGEGAFLTLEPESARRRLVEELSSPNPNTGVFREYAALDVRLNPASLPAEPPPESSASKPSPEDKRPRPEVVARPATPVAEHQGSKAKSSNRPPAGAPSAPEGAAEGASASCRWCSSPLPARASLRFCPFCGTDIKLVPCASCGEALESGWRFCIQCGAAAAGG